MNNGSGKVEVGHDRQAALAARQGQHSCRPVAVRATQTKHRQLTDCHHALTVGHCNEHRMIAAGLRTANKS